ncbi:MAG: hypothetical protein NT062_23240 [Proteobacteria bacterium]|nr:hypothetical protein [Pseudomonadota bacterium]
MRRAVALGLVVAPALAHADGPPAPRYDANDPAQLLGASLGVATGSRITPGGLRLAGHYLYQVTQDDYVEGGASFTIGSGEAACFHDRRNDFTCDHAIFDGKGVELTGAIRHYFAANGAFHPFTRVGLGVALVRFSDDEVTGLGVTLRGGAGILAQVTDGIGIVVQAELALGAGGFGHGLGLEPQLGSSVLAGVEFSLE